MTKERNPRTLRNRLIAVGAAGAIALSTSGCNSSFNEMFKDEQAKVGLKGAKLPASLEVDLYMVNRQADPINISQPAGDDDKKKRISFIDKNGAAKVDFKKPAHVSAEDIDCGVVTYKDPTVEDKSIAPPSVAGYAKEWPGRTDGVSCLYEFNDNGPQSLTSTNGNSELQEAVLTQVDRLNDVLAKAQGRLAVGSSLYAGNN